MVGSISSTRVISYVTEFGVGTDPSYPCPALQTFKASFLGGNHSRYQSVRSLMRQTWGPAFNGRLPFAPAQLSWSLLGTTVALELEAVACSAFPPGFTQIARVSRTLPLHLPRDHPLVVHILRTTAAERRAIAAVVGQYPSIHRSSTTSHSLGIRSNNTGAIVGT